GGGVVGGLFHYAIIGMAEQKQASGGSEQPGVVMPAPTAWPFAMALGSALMFTGLLTDVSVSILGGILTLCGAVGWFRQVLPHEHHEVLPVELAEPARVVPPRRVERLEVAEEIHRAWVPLK